MTIAFFDFDGTITNRDTLWEIVRFHRGRASLLAGVIMLSPALVLFKLKMISAQDMKQRVLQYFFGGMPEEVFRKGCEAFCRERLPHLLRPLALTAIRKHQRLGHQVVIVTASAQQWVMPWCRTIHVRCISTVLEVKNNRITGNILGANCNGEEKVRRIHEVFRLEEYQTIFAYGDSRGDKPMLSLAQYPHYKPFRSVG
ncbi:HAD-IB family hydrolase [Chitinophaga vietnamensis]|uniref:HAD-IB family hydrolase n=1 Tax=Chitinophaga vietnamensis TaxID=2593957 RepID=UPI0011776A7C|nr:HAD-IB family hydrolase [Chitinophaga vietnamensis]